MKILIIDDHPVLPAGLKATLQDAFPAYEYITCINLKDASSILFSGDAPAVSLVLCDLLLGPDHGSDLLTYMQAFSGPRIPIMMLSGVTEQATVNSCRGLGAKGYVSKTDNPDVLVEAVRTVLAGGEHFPSWDTNCRSQFLDRALKLSEQRRVIMDLTIGAMTNKEIARVLNIAEGTVKNHLREIMSTLAARNRTDLGLQAARCGYTPRTVPGAALS
jgi:DNA-binding NarL/FixJ family response regulator